MRRPPASELHLPEGIRYDCIQCGRGCTDFWEIPVDPESEERLAAFDLKAYQQRAHDEPPFIDSEFDKGDRALNRVNDVCTFLCEDKTCALHAALGPTNKPQTCIDFPYRYVETPAGAYVGVSFACTAVRQNSGRLLTEKAAEIGGNFGHSIHFKQTAAPVRLTARASLSFDAYLELERALDEILSIPRVALWMRLLAQSVFIDLVSKALEAGKNPGTGDLTSEELAALGALPDTKLVAAFAQRFRADNWGRLLLMAQKQRPSPMVHRAFIGLVTTFRQALWRNATRPKALLYILRHYTLHAAGLSRIHLQPLPKRFRYADFQERRVETESGSFYDTLLTRYFRHVLFRKDLLLAENVRAGHRFLLMHFALVQWYLVGLMAEAGETVASDETVENALLNVEKYYVLHTTYTKFLENQPLLGTLIDAVIHTPKYAASLVHPPVRPSTVPR
ncbi:MAG: lysine-N-methylase [Candidatus Sumerlaeota bacterium]|nr:lysine-N-methylase [Candidatus Sumerlaeota bacterium]